MIGRWLIVLLPLLPGAAPDARSAVPLSLPEALRITLEEHPALDVYPLRDSGLRGTRDQAALRPPVRLGLEVENVAGTGALSAAARAESTLSLSSVIELGGDRRARVAVADAARGRNAVERDVLALDLLAGTTLAFVRAVADRERLDVAESATRLAEETLATVATRVDRGLAPRPELLRAEAQLRVARLGVAQARRNLEVARVELAARMGSRDVAVEGVVGDLFTFEEVIGVDELFARAERNPSILVLANEERLRDASLALERARASVDLAWSVGFRRLEESGDAGFVASLGLPLGQRARSRGAVAAATAARDEVPIRREAALLDLYARLFDAYQMRRWGVEAVRMLGDENLPALEEALELTTQAYLRGRYTYLDVLATQREWLDARSRLIDIAAATAEAGVRLEQLTAESPVLHRGGVR